MSTFNGLFDEIPYISVDHFCEENLESKLFFLSHCHSDHMVGLYNSPGLPGPLYTSSVSAVFLKKQFSCLEKYIIVIELNSPLELEYEVNDEKYTIYVTALSARHCPGSVMFLFQTLDCNLLYTGDFRLTSSDLQKNYIKLRETPIDIVYLDSTFLSEKFPEFPTQIESINKIIEIINNLDSSTKIYLYLPAQYGYEYLMTEISRKLQMKIFVPERQEQKYIYFPNMDDCISGDNSERIQVIDKYNYDKVNFNDFIIKPSAMYWHSWRKTKPFVKITGNEIRVAFSTHSSLNEIQEFLNFIKPKKVKLNVEPKEQIEREAKYKLLNEIYPLQEKPILRIDHQKDLIPKEKTPNFTNVVACKIGESITSEPNTSKLELKLPKRKKIS